MLLLASMENKLNSCVIYMAGKVITIFIMDGPVKIGFVDTISLF